MKYSQELIQKCRAYFKEKHDHIISEETAEQYLDSLASLYRCFQKSIQQKSGESPTY